MISETSLTLTEVAKRVSEASEVGKSPLLKHLMPYKPDQMKEIAFNVMEANRRYWIAELEEDSQFKGDLYEAIAAQPLRNYGKLTKLQTINEHGERTADYKLELEKVLAIGKYTFKTGESIIFEIKSGGKKYVLGEFSDENAHGSQQLLRTMREYGASHGVALVTMEIQNFPDQCRQIRTWMKQHPSKIFFHTSLPYEGAVKCGVKLAREEKQQANTQISK